MGTLVDGLGNEELGGTGDTGSKVAQLWVTGSLTAESQISGANVFATGSAIAGRVEDSLGQLRSTVVSHAGSTYGALVQAGSVATAAGSGGTIVFANNFASANYLVTLTPTNFVAGAGSAVPYPSGTRNVSGCEVVGGASTVYDYVAVGV